MVNHANLANTKASKQLAWVVISLTCCLLLACRPDAIPRTTKQSLPFVLLNKGQALECDTPSSQPLWQVTQMAFFASEVKIGSAQEAPPAQLVDSDWQANGIALLDLSPCAPQSNAQLVVSNSTDWHQAKRLSFTLGVPFAHNHLNPLVQPSPLNLPHMFWSWQSGYKFMRLDLQGESPWSFHLGSVGCRSVSPVRGPITPCKQPNRLQINVSNPRSAGSTPEKSRIVLHLDRLLEGVDVTQAKSCMFQQAQLAVCEQLLTNLVHNQVFEWQ